MATNCLRALVDKNTHRVIPEHVFFPGEVLGFYTHFFLNTNTYKSKLHRRNESGPVP